MTKASHQSLRKDVMTFFHYMIYLSLNDKYAFPGRTTFPPLTRLNTSRIFEKGRVEVFISKI
jgi:hypothetical protein